MREFSVRLTVRTNENDEPGDEPYYDDEEMGRVLGRWLGDALYDRDDSPRVVWGEVVLRKPVEIERIRKGDGS